jgi:hypothetical protein
MRIDGTGLPMPVHCTSQVHDMPMRGELAAPGSRSEDGGAGEGDVWAVVGFCLIGLAVSLYMALSAQSLDQIPLLIVQYNLG